MSADEIRDKIYWLVKECQDYPDLAYKLTPAIEQLRNQLREAAQ